MRSWYNWLVCSFVSSYLQCLLLSFLGSRDSLELKEKKEKTCKYIAGPEHMPLLHIRLYWTETHQKTYGDFFFSLFSPLHVSEKQKVQTFDTHAVKSKCSRPLSAVVQFSPNRTNTALALTPFVSQGPPCFLLLVGLQALRGYKTHSCFPD